MNWGVSSHLITNTTKTEPVPQHLFSVHHAHVQQSGPILETGKLVINSRHLSILFILNSEAEVLEMGCTVRREDRKGITV